MHKPLVPHTGALPPAHTTPKLGTPSVESPLTGHNSASTWPQPASRESNQPKWCGQAMTQCPALGPSTHLHEMLLHVGCKVAQDTHLSLQLLRDGGHREHQVSAAGRVVMYSPGTSTAQVLGMSILAETPPPTQGPSPETEISPIPTAHLWLGESVMCVPLLKSTPMLRLESW